MRNKETEKNTHLCLKFKRFPYQIQYNKIQQQQQHITIYMKKAWKNYITRTMTVRCLGNRDQMQHICFRFVDVLWVGKLADLFCVSDVNLRQTVFCFCTTLFHQAKSRSE